ncbi:MAG: ribonuclease H-like domain-containing protein [Patescibacteria group bacterium]|nr:ribonuclease H-like domain-containing protein [Patescibacteria group bacterium]
MAKIVFDIETAGEDFEKMDDVTREVLTKKIKKELVDENEIKKQVAKIAEELVFSPLTAKIVAIGVLDADTKKGAVYFDSAKKMEGEESPAQTVQPFEEGGVQFKSMSEKEMLESFWKVCEHAEEFVSFNGRGFDVPFLMIRSAIHKIKPSKNLLANRYMNLQPRDAKHVDLMDQLNFYGAVWGRTNLHLCCRAFGIKSPKEDGVAGDDVTRLFGEGKFDDIARYNARDLHSTRDLYEYWDKFLRF